jgi:phospholipid/cholesterol/gamma-HCH transport system permease protein
MLDLSTTPSNKANFLEILGSAFLYLLKSFKYIIHGEVQKEQLVSRLLFIGYESILMVVALCSLASMILTYNTAIELTKHGGRELVGALVAIADLREIIPTFIGFAIAARCGTALTAEVSTMKVTEQIDALKVLRIDPIYFLLAPTVLAIILLSPFILAIASMVSMFAGMLVAKLVVNLEFAEFLESAWGNIGLKEYFYPLIKVEVFCLYALLINITMGLNCSGGAKEVGLTTTKATALVIVGIVILDGFLTTLLFID